jgi:hypothetical protein
VAANRKPVTPDQKSRDLQRDFRTLQKEDPSPERAAALATLARAAHVDRQLNLAMLAAQQCLDEDPSQPNLLVAAYAMETPGESRLLELADLRDLARYLDRRDLVDVADRDFEAAARQWVIAAENGERRYRLRTVQSLGSRALADTLRDELDEM